MQPRDAREASDVFYKQGTGDVLLNYENEVYFTNKMYEAKDRLPYIVPDRNVRVSDPAQCQTWCGCIDFLEHCEARLIRSAGRAGPSGRTHTLPHETHGAEASRV